MGLTLRKGSAAGGKLTGNHSTVTDPVAALIKKLHALDCVTKLSPGIIKQAPRGRFRIKTAKQSDGCVLATVRGTTTIQELWIYADDVDMVCDFCNR